MWIAVLGSVKVFPNLEAALKGVFNRVVTKLWLSNNNIGLEGAIAIAEALKVNAVVTTLSLGSNNIGVEGAIAIAKALKVTAVLTTLRLDSNRIGAEGSKAIAEALKVNAVLKFFLNASADAQKDALEVLAMSSFRFLNASHFQTSAHIAVSHALRSS